MMLPTVSLRFIKRFDAYSKPLEDFRVNTISGACLTVVSMVVIVSLFVSEVNYFMTIDVQQEIFVDMSRSQKLRINLDITFPSLACEYITLDSMDVSGEEQNDIIHDIYKFRLNLDGTSLSKALKQNVTTSKEKVDNDTLTTYQPAKELDENYCGSCYGAAIDSRQCCNTCENVREMYRLRGWALGGGVNFEQCRREGVSGVNMTFNDQEGCRYAGFLMVNKMAGNFHIALGRSVKEAHGHMHDINSLPNTAKFNLTHRFNKLTYGDDFPGAVHPLDGFVDTEEKDKAAATYNYYTTIVRTTYVHLDGSVTNTNQFSVTKHMRAPLSGVIDRTSGVPGVFVNYDIGPMMVKISERKRPLIHFITSLCAVIGGVFTVSSLMDSLILWIFKKMTQK